jgi:hypothetical protein
MNAWSLKLILDVLDAFKADSKPKRSAPQPPTDPSVSSSRPRKNSTLEEDPADLFGEEFAAQLQEGMAELLKELGQAPKDGEDPHEIAEMRKAWERMLVASMDGGDADSVKLPGVFGGTPPSTNSGPPPSKDAPAISKAESSSKSGEKDFQQTIRQAMEKLKNSEEALKVCDPCNPGGMTLRS